MAGLRDCTPRIQLDTLKDEQLDPHPKKERSKYGPGWKSLSETDSRQHVLGGKLRPPSSKAKHLAKSLEAKSQITEGPSLPAPVASGKRSPPPLFQDMPGCRQQCREPEAVVMSTKESSEQGH